MESFDFRKEYRASLMPKPGQVEFVIVPAMHFLMLDGHGDPNTSMDYQASFAALYGIAYNLKFRFKKERGIDYNLLAIECLWWVQNMELFSAERKDDWCWTMMLFQPYFISIADVREAVTDIAMKKHVPGLEKVRYEVYKEGLSAQTMHLGSYSEEKPAIDLLHQSIAEHGYVKRGKHHEIYLGDPRKSAPEKLKTIIRQPVEKDK
ncbi:MAG: hypothetical protein C0391_02265 [Anaerolinea sp.]|nr:hypothetical protein [Anaerolinea sp.]